MKKHLFSSLFVAVVIAACGSRTGLLVDEFEDASIDGASPDVQTRDVSVDRSVRDALADVRGDGPIREGGVLDVTTDCGAPAYCDPNNLDFVFKCGVPIIQCSSLEQCKNAKCVNPCQDTLGQDTSNGCEFYATEMDVTPEAEGVCYAVFIVNQWPTGEPARIEVSRGGTVLPIDQFARIPVGTGTNITYAPYSNANGLAKDQIAILFLSRDPAAANDPDVSAPRRLAGCPAGVTPAVLGDAALHGTGIGTAFHVKTNVPVVAYQMLPYGGGRARLTGATLLLPTNVWGDNYVAANAYTAPTSFTELRAGPTMVVIAQEDQTHIRVRPNVPIIAGGGVAGTPANVPVTYTIDKGRYVQFTQPTELTGSAIQSDKPVAVIGGSTLMDVPVNRVRADSAEQMLPPVKALGNQYVGVRYRTRGSVEEVVPWRIVGVVDGTQLTFDPPVPGAPPTVDARQLRQFDASGPFVVSSQDAAHPFYFAQYMTGGEPFDGEGDPEFVNVITPQQYLPRYTFFTDPTYPETNLVVVRTRDATLGAFPDVALDCAGTLSGWQDVGTSGNFQFTRINLSTGNFQGQNGCNNGVHTIVSSFAVDSATLVPRIGVTVWGWGNPITYAPDNGPTDEANPKFTRWVSYGYPAGANITSLNGVVLSAQ